MRVFHFAHIDTGRIAACEAHEVPHLLPRLCRQLNAVKYALMAFLYPIRNGILLPVFQSIVISSYSINRDQRGCDEQEDVFMHPGPLGMFLCRSMEVSFPKPLQTCVRRCKAT